MRAISSFNIFKQERNVLNIYKSGLIDAANCIIRSKLPDPPVENLAKAEIRALFDMIFSSAETVEYIRMYYLKRRDSGYEDFTSIYRFRLWMIENQTTPSIGFILRQFNLYCRNRHIHIPRINIVFGDYYKNTIYNTNMYFNNTYDNIWLEDELIKQAIKDVDKSNVINSESIFSPILGTIPPSRLSGGVKTLILIYNNPDKIFNASACGDNCSKWIYRFSKEKDFMINLYHAMNFRVRNFKAYIVNSDTIINSMEELYIAADQYCRG